jgi:hypothetical protein
MRPLLCALALFASITFITVSGCARNGAARDKPRADAPPTDAPKETIGIEAPAGGSATDARRVEPEKVEPPPAAEREYKPGVTEKELGLPFYPKSTELRPGGVLRDSSGVAAQSFRVSEEPPQVIAEFYKKKMDVLLHEIRDATSLTIVGKRNGRECTIVLVQREGKTQINVFTKAPKG